jgi:large subunit ribosomal protein L15
MRLDDLYPSPGSKQKPKRVGRGPGSGSGKTASRGHKGQKSRSGVSLKPGFEGGQMPLTRRMPKRGFTNAPFKTVYAVVNLRDLTHFPADTVVDEDLLRNTGLVKKNRPIKLLGQGDIAVALTVKVQAASRQAKERIEAAGGKVEVG